MGLANRAATFYAGQIMEAQRAHLHAVSQGSEQAKAEQALSVGLRVCEDEQHIQQLHAHCSLHLIYCCVGFACNCMSSTQMGVCLLCHYDRDMMHSSSGMCCQACIKA